MTAVTIGQGRWRGFSFARKRRTGTAWHALVLALVVLAVIGPLSFLVLGSFSLAKLPSDFSFTDLTFANYAKVWGDASTYQVFLTTLWFAGGSTLVSIAVAGMLAWCVERTNMPCKMWIYAGVPTTMAMPGMLQAMAWILLASPRIGFLNTLWMQAGFTSPLFDIYSLGGLIFVEGLRGVPTAFLMLVPLLRSMDPSLEEAAAMSGANPLSTLRKVTFGLMLPGLLAVSIYQFTSSLEGFEVPGILGLPSGVYVFSTKIYMTIQSQGSLPAFGEANALSMFYLLVAVVSIGLYRRVIKRSESYSIVTGKGYRPRTAKLGWARWLVLLFSSSYLLLSTVIPFIVFLYMSFLPYVEMPSAEVFKKMSWSNYADIFSDDRLAGVVANTLWMTAAVAVTVALVSLVVSIIVVRSKFKGRGLLDQIVFLPHAIPGMVFGLALLWIFLQIDKLGVNLFGSISSLIVAFVIGYLPYGTRVTNAALMQIHKDLDDAAKMSGATPLRVMRRVFFPLLLPSLTGLMIWTILHVVRSAGIPLMLSDGSENEVLAVTIWKMWDQGDLTQVSGIGTLLIIALLAMMLGMRLFGFARGVRLDR